MDHLEIAKVFDQFRLHVRPTFTAIDGMLDDEHLRDICELELACNIRSKGVEWWRAMIGDETNMLVELLQFTSDELAATTSLVGAAVVDTKRGIVIRIIVMDQWVTVSEMHQYDVANEVLRAWISAYHGGRRLLWPVPDVAS